MMVQSQDELLEVGVIIGTHGLRGDLKVRPLPTGDLALDGARTVILKDGEGRGTPYAVASTKPHKQHILIRLAGHESIDAVQPLLRCSVWMKCADLGALPADEHYWHQLRGLELVDQRRGAIGRVVGMFSTPAHDILEVDGPLGEVLVPMVEPFIDAVDLTAGRILVDLPDGLLPERDEDADAV